MYKLLVVRTLFLISLTACRPGTPDVNSQILSAVAATVAAIPTYTPYPVPTPYTAPTPRNLTGLFCEYKFCVGHPNEMAYYDVSAARDQANPSSYDQGMIASYNQTIFILLTWQSAPGQTDPQFMLDLMLDDIDTRDGNLDIKLIHDLNVLYTPITTTATPVLPYGAAAAWICGDRAFGWKIYTVENGTASTLLDETLNRFQCD